MVGILIFKTTGKTIRSLALACTVCVGFGAFSLYKVTLFLIYFKGNR